MNPVQFWFDFAGTYSYPAAMRIAPLAQAAGVAVTWHPFLLGPIFAEQGWTDSPFNLQPLKGRYMWRDMERVCAAAGLPWRRPSQFPRNGLLAARIGCRHAAAPWLPAFCREVYRANFADDRDIAAPELIAGILDRLGQPGAALVEETQSPASKSLLREQVERARSLGLFGAPTFLVEGELFWGNDRLEQALAWAAGSRPDTQG